VVFSATARCSSKLISDTDQVYCCSNSITQQQATDKQQINTHRYQHKKEEQKAITTEGQKQGTCANDLHREYQKRRVGCCDVIDLGPAHLDTCQSLPAADAVAEHLH